LFKCLYCDVRTMPIHNWKMLIILKNLLEYTLLKNQ
jgi:hypothetical protein